MKKKIECSLDQVKDKYIGKPGTPEREQYEFKLQLDVLKINSQKIKDSIAKKKIIHEYIREGKDLNRLKKYDIKFSLPL